MGHGKHAANGQYGYDGGDCHRLAAILPEVHFPPRHKEAIVLVGLRAFDSASNWSYGCRLIGGYWSLLFN
jgi:hypothetical protein